MVGGTSALVKDIGSTNGTFINQFPIQEAVLQSGQTLQLGNVEMGYETVPARYSVSPHPPDIPIPRALNAGRPVSAPVPELAHMEAAQERTLFHELPGAFRYPFKKDGWLLLVGGTLFFAFLNFLMTFAMLFALPIAIFSGGYLFSYMQAIITSSAQGEDELPPWPDFSDFIQDIVYPFVQTTGAILICFGPGLFVPLFVEQNTILRATLLIIGGLHFPMALTGVSIAQSLSGLNPAVILPSILRVPLQYAVACAVLGVVAGIHMASDVYLRKLIGSIPLVTNCIGGFLSFYFLAVEMRILGLLYFTNRDRLRWI